MKREIQQRLGWVKLYEKNQDAVFVCRRCGISRPTLRSGGADSGVRPSRPLKPKQTTS